jgi:chromosome partitioning protein
VGIEKALAAEVGAEALLRKRAGALAAEEWDYVLIDGPPTLGILTVNALTTAQELLVPVEGHVMALNELVQLLQTVEAVKERLHAHFEVAGILACRVDARHALEVVEQLRERFPKLVYRTVIRENVRLAECPSFGQPLPLYQPSSHGAEDYRALASEVLQQERKQ